jgi:hypothetical protein
MLRGWANPVVKVVSWDARALNFVAMSALLLVWHGSAVGGAMYGDAAGYWALAHSFGDSHHFSFDGYADHLRGYSLPLMLHGVQQAALALGVDDVVFFRGVSACVGSAVFAIAAPSLFTHILDAPRSVARTAVFCLLGLVFWRGHFMYSLSDFPALLLMTVGVLCLPPCPGGTWTRARALTSGICLTLAANARPVYAVSLLGAALLVSWSVAIAHDRPRAAVPVALFVLGVTVVLLPQSAINRRLLGTRNPFAHGRASLRQPSLYMQQLAWGVAIQRYETNIGAGFPSAVIFLDSRGQKLLLEDLAQDPRAAISRIRLGPQGYLRLVSEHPVFFASAFGRHLFNGLDVAYSTPYVDRIAPRSATVALVNYIILCLAAVQASLRRSGLPASGGSPRRSGPGWRLSLGAVFVLPALVAIPTAVEPRFVLPLWMLIHGYVVFRLSWRGMLALFRRWYVAPAVALGVLVCFGIASATYSLIGGAPASYDVWCLWC